ncbi:MAG TPA: ATP-binding cassette domain-containing protein [Alphaproteobacteria bacterium]|nr:ATP-binding cassette domain-containing protein [Alphaproteobacteria bacterium]
MDELIRRLKLKPALTAELVVASFFANLLALASPLFVTQVLNRYVNYRVNATLVTLAVGMVMALALEFSFRQVRIRIARCISAGPDRQAMLASFGVLTKARLAALERIPPGLRREILDGAAAVENSFNANNLAALFDVPFALLFVFVLSLLSPVLALIVLFFMAVVFASAAVGAKAVRQRSRELLNAAAMGNTLVNTAVREAETVRSFNAGPFLDELWQKQSAVTSGLRQWIIGRQGLLQIVTRSAAGYMSLFIITFGAILVVDGDLSIGALIGSNILASRALMPIARLASLIAEFIKAEQSLKIMREFAKLPLEAVGGSAKRQYSGAIELRDLAFVYPGAKGPLFESMNLTLAPGEILCVNGANGSGKTTLARLITGILEPVRGHVFVDGLDLRQTAPAWWRRQIVYLPQEPAFLNATLGENLKINNPEVQEERLNQIIDAAGLRDFLDESDGGFQTPITNNGRHLALGVRRRLALARALTTDGKLAVFDEPMEGLDAEGRKAVAGVIKALVRGGRAVILMSHDAGLLKEADIILDLNMKPSPKVTRMTDELRAVAKAAKAAKAGKKQEAAAQ